MINLKAKSQEPRAITLRNKRIMVTGGVGFLGKHLVLNRILFEKRKCRNMSVVS